MLTARTRLDTARGSQYLQQLCKHFAHRVPVEYDAGTGRAEFQPGSALLRADDGGLDIEVRSRDAAGLRQVRDVIESHLLRFAHREEPEPLRWTS